MRRLGAIAAVGPVLALTLGCGGGQVPAGEGSGSARSQAPATGSGSMAGAANKVNMEEIFPPGPGRDLVLNNCQNCHTFVPLVVLQMDKDAWQRNSVDHRERVASLSDADFKQLYEYVSTTFTPERPVPTLPKELLESWTSY